MCTSPLPPPSAANESQLRTSPSRVVSGRTAGARRRLGVCVASTRNRVAPFHVILLLRHLLFSRSRGSSVSPAFDAAVVLARFGWGSGRRLTLLLVREPRPARGWRPGLRLPKLERRREPARGEVGADANEIQGSRRPAFLHFSPSFPWVSLGRPDQMQTTVAWVKPPSYRPVHPERSFTKPEPIGAIFLFTRARA